MKRDEALQAWRAMSDNEKIAAVARNPMGLDVDPDWPLLGKVVYWFAGPDDELLAADAPDFIHDHAAAYAVEEKLAEMGLQMGVQLHRKLALEAMQIVTPECLTQYVRAGHESAINQHLWLLYHATPEQRCCAVWVTLKTREQP